MDVQAMVSTVTRAVLGPFFRSRVTVPSVDAPQVIENGLPTGTLTSVLKVKALLAAATAASAEKRRLVVNCMLAFFFYSFV